jgi:ankyrin repeat protein
MLLAADANPNNRSDKGVGRDCIMYAVHDGSLRLVKLLVEAGADLTYRDSENKSALDYAKIYNRRKVVEYLEDVINMSLE